MASTSPRRRGSRTSRSASQATSRTIIASRTARRRSTGDVGWAAAVPHASERSRRDSAAMRGKKLDGSLETVRCAGQSAFWISSAASRNSGRRASRLGESISALISMASPAPRRWKSTVRRSSSGVVERTLSVYVTGASSVSVERGFAGLFRGVERASP